MHCETKWLAAAVGVCLLGLAGGAAFAQATATETRSFEVISVDGNKVVAREAEGAKASASFAGVVSLTPWEIGKS